MAEESPSPAGRLSVVATPIGNLEDVTLRALRVLREADLIAAEDTRHTRVLLQRHGIDRPLLSLHEHNEDERIDSVLARVRDGAKVALVSDAGTPTVNDPGFRLVRAARDAGLPVEVIPGPSAVMAAVAGAGLPAASFAFLGFPPRKAGELARWAKDALALPTAVVFFESPRRVLDSLAALAAIEPARPASVCRELTKRHEEFVRGDLASVHGELSAREEILGEITVLLAEPGERAAPAFDEAAEIARLRADGKGDKEIAKAIAKATGRKSSDVYAVLVREKGRR